RFQRAGILPSPRVISLGRGYGTRSVYPPGTGRQLVTLLEIHEREHRLRHVGWSLWWEGDYVVSPRVWRQVLQGAADLWEKGAAEFVRTSSDDQRLRSLADERIESRTIRRV